MKFFEFIALHNYFQGIVILIISIAFVFSLRYYGRHRALRIIPYYLAFWLFMEGLEFGVYISPKGDSFANALEKICIPIFTVFEYCVFSMLILQYIAGARRRLAIKLNTVFFSMALILLLFRAYPQNPIVSTCLLEIAGFSLPFGMYLYELFTNMDMNPLKDRPSFWIVLGIICQTAFNSSLDLSMEYMGRFSDGAYAFAILFYCILFLLFMRAYKCPPEKSVAF